MVHVYPPTYCPAPGFRPIKRLTHKPSKAPTLMMIGYPESGLADRFHLKVSNQIRNLIFTPILKSTFQDVSLVNSQTQKTTH